MTETAPRATAVADPIAEAPTKAQAMEAAFAARKTRQRTQIAAEIKRRFKLRAACLKSEKIRGVALRAASESPARFCNDWLWTYDPRNSGREGLPTRLPFVLRPRQRELMAWLGGREDAEENGLIEKSRDEGMSFCVLAYMLHGWLFREGFSAGIGSRKEKLVDEIGNLDALMPKLRMMLYALPQWMLDECAGESFSRNEHDNHLRLVNPKNGSSITGEAGDNIGRGGRNTFYFVDEWAFVARPRLVNAALSQNTNVVIKGSTPNGVGNRFYEERHSGRISVFTMHWRDNPAKNYEAAYVDEDGELRRFFPWREKQEQEDDPVTLAQEVDISYTASTANTVIPAAWVQAAIGFALSEGHPNRSGFDVAGGGADDDVYCNRRGPVVRRLVKLAKGNPAEKASEVERLAREDECEILNYDRLGVGEGQTATLKHKEEQLPFAVHGVANSERPTSAQLDDSPKVPANERFKTFADEQWWGLRLRFQATWKRANGIAHAPDVECISIPNDPTLIAQLSQPTYSKDSKELIKVDKKGEGGSSPDYAEAMLYAFAPERGKPEDWSNAEGVW